MRGRGRFGRRGRRRYDDDDDDNAMTMDEWEARQKQAAKSSSAGGFADSSGVALYAAIALSKVTSRLLNPSAQEGSLPCQVQRCMLPLHYAKVKQAWHS